MQPLSKQRTLQNVPGTRDVLGNTIAFIGDSITAGSITTNYLGDSFAVYISVVSKQRLVSTGYYGVPGETTAQMLTRVQAALSGSPAFLHILGGTNDIGQGVSANQTDNQILATFQTGIKGLCQAARSVGTTPVLGTVPPNNGGGQRQWVILKANAWLRRYAIATNTPLIDYYSILIAGGTAAGTAGQYKAGYSTDGTHPTSLAQVLMAQQAVATLGPLIPQYSPPLCNDVVDASHANYGSSAYFYLLENPLFLQSTTHANFPDGVFSYSGNFAPSGTTFSIVTNANVPGNMWQIAQSAGSTQGGQISLQGTGLIGGNKHFIAGYFTSDDGVQSQVQVVVGGTTFTPALFTTPSTPISPGMYYMEFVVPGTGVQSATINLLVGSGTGTVAFGYPSLVDMTANAVA